MGFLFATIGWLAGLGFLNYPLAALAGPAGHATGRAGLGAGRYFRLQHRPQGDRDPVLLRRRRFFLIGGINAMLIRVELLTPNEKAFPAGQYLSLVGLHGTMMIMMTSAFILGPFGNYFVPLMIGARRMAFPRIEALTFWLTPLAGARAAVGDRLERLPDRLDRLRAARRPGPVRDGRVHRGVHADRRLAVPERAQPDGDDPDDAAPGTDLDASADLRLGRALDVDPDGARRAGPARGAPDGADGPDREHVSSTSRAGRQPVPVRESLLVLRPPRGVHPGAARLRDRARDPARVRAQAALGVPPRGRRHARRRLPQLLRLAAPPLRQRHQREPAALLHADDRADLDPDGLHLPERDGDDLARPHALHGADAVLARVLLQLPDRRPLGGLPLRRAERRDDARLVLRDGPLPLHDHGRPRLRVLRGHLLLAPEDERHPVERDGSRRSTSGRCSSSST